MLSIGFCQRLTPGGLAEAFCLSCLSPQPQASRCQDAQPPPSAQPPPTSLHRPPPMSLDTQQLSSPQTQPHFFSATTTSSSSPAHARGLPSSSHTPSALSPLRRLGLFPAAPILTSHKRLPEPMPALGIGLDSGLGSGLDLGLGVAVEGSAVEASRGLRSCEPQPQRLLHTRDLRLLNLAGLTLTSLVLDACRSKPSTLNPKPSTLKPSTPNPRPQTLDPKP